MGASKGLWNTRLGRMLEKLHIRGFQCHERLTINFDPLATVLVGRSDVGKSAILRALRWVCTNRPGGSAFIQHDAKFSRVTLFADGRKITRSKGIKNVYRLDDHLYKAFGSGVPDDIVKLLNVGSVNFAGQLDAPFWFLKSPGEVAKELNSVVNLTLIDAVQAKIASELRQAKAREEVSEQRLQEASHQVDQLSWVEGAREGLLNLVSLEKQCETTRAQIARLRKLLADVQKVEAFRDRASKAIVVLAKVVRQGERVQVLRARVERLRNLLRSIEETRGEVCRAQKRVEKAAAELREQLKGRCPVCGNPLPSLFPS